jgi:hypothetical protein
VPTGQAGVAHAIWRLLFRFSWPMAGRVRRVMWLAVPARVGFADGEAELLELGDELAQAAVVVEPGTIVGQLLIRQDAGGGLAVFLAGPLVVGAVQLSDWRLSAVSGRHPKPSPSAMRSHFTTGSWLAPARTSALVR